MVTYDHTKCLSWDTFYIDMCYVLMSLTRSPEVKRSQIFDIFQNLEYRHKQPYQGQERTDLATFTPKCVRLGNLL